MIFLHALRVSFVLFVTKKALESKVNGIAMDPGFSSSRRKPVWGDGPLQHVKESEPVTAGAIRI